MKNKNALIIVGIIGAVLVLGALGFLALSLSAARGSKADVLAEYFRALSTQDAQKIEKLTTGTFVSDLPLDGLSPKTYRLYSFSVSENDSTHRFAPVVTKPDGSETIYMADASHSAKGLSSRIESIKLIQVGRRIKE